LISYASILTSFSEIISETENYVKGVKMATSILTSFSEINLELFMYFLILKNPSILTSFSEMPETGTR